MTNWDYSRVALAYYDDHSLIVIQPGKNLGRAQYCRTGHWWRFPDDSIVSEVLAELGLVLYPELLPKRG